MAVKICLSTTPTSQVRASRRWPKRDEYGVEASFESIGVVAARWVRCDDRAHLDEFTKKLTVNVARDHSGALVYLAPSTVSLTLTQERWPKVQFFATRELSAVG